LSKTNIFDKAYALSKSWAKPTILIPFRVSKSWKKKHIKDLKRIKNQEIDPMRNNSDSKKRWGTIFDTLWKNVKVRLALWNWEKSKGRNNTWNCWLFRVFRKDRTPRNNTWNCWLFSVFRKDRTPRNNTWNCWRLNCFQKE